MPNNKTIICGPCAQKFGSDADFLNHACPAAEGAKPTTPDYVIKTTQPNFAKVSEAAVKRGAEKTKAK